MSKMTDNEIVSRAMRILGSKTSARKSIAAKINGKKGGRPPKKKSESLQVVDSQLN